MPLPFKKPINARYKRENQSKLCWPANAVIYFLKWVCRLRHKSMSRRRTMNTASRFHLQSHKRDLSKLKKRGNTTEENAANHWHSFSSPPFVRRVSRHFWALFGRVALLPTTHRMDVSAKIHPVKFYAYLFQEYRIISSQKGFGMLFQKVPCWVYSHLYGLLDQFIKATENEESCENQLRSLLLSLSCIWNMYVKPPIKDQVLLLSTVF